MIGNIDDDSIESYRWPKKDKFIQQVLFEYLLCGGH